VTDIGLVVLARDEEAVIRRCLDSVAADCRQMVVLDMQSVDRTAELAAAAGAEVVPVPVQRQFDGLRQLALDRLTTEWVIQLDADEWAPELLPRLASEGLLDVHRPIAVPKMNLLAGRWVKSNRWWPNYQVRVFPRAGARYVDTFHDYLRVPGEPLRLPAQPEYAIRHDSYASVEEMLNSTARYLPEQSQELSLRQVLRVIGRPLAGYVTSRAWRDGTDGLAILSAKIVNAIGKEASGGRR
jgi:glycosyltransferase involved in cell wall biosynthesis